MGARPDFRQSVAVAIGIDAYSDGVPPLKTAAGDARRLARLLADAHGYDVHLLLDEQATQQAIAGLLTEELPGTIGPEDRLLFYFAGHGIALEGDDGPTGYLLLQDARRGEPETYLHMPALYDALCALECRHMLVLLDSCFSGAFRWSSTRNIVALPEVIHQERYDRFILDPAWQAIASASHDQTALDELPGTFGERGEDESGHSPFAHALFDALEGAADIIPAGDGDGVITATELYLYLEHRLQPATIEAGHRQTPRLWPLAKHDKGEFIFLAPGHELNLPPAPPLTYENNPWRGLESYDEAHAPLFFGRDEVIAELEAHVENHPLTVVLGASGTGKSSVVKAGLIPRLKADVAQAWHVRPIVRPGADPMQALEQAVTELGSGETVEERVAAWCAEHPGERLVLVVDQFEELVTMTREAEAREATLALLLRLVETHPEQLRVILTLRSDFEPQFDRSVLETHWKEGCYVVPPMTQDEIRAVIEQPASQRVMYFKPHGLVDALINEVIQTPGGLPLLSFALSEMYVHYIDRRSDDRALETVDYEAVGGVVGALRTRADAEFEALDTAHRETMRRLMLRMVASEGGNVARRRVLRSELEYPDAAETERAREVVRRLTASRLVVEGRGEHDEPYVEPAHDALVRAWARLTEWIHAEQDRAANLRFQQSLARTARDWTQAEDEKMKAGLLWRDAARGGVLAQLVAHEEEHLPPATLTTGQRLNRRARALRHRLLPAARTQDDAGVWMNRRELAFAQRSIRRRRTIRLGLGALVLLIAVGAVAATVFGIMADRERQRAERERDNALSGALAARSTSAMQSGDRALATLLAVQGNRIVETPQTRKALLQSLQSPSDYSVYPHPQEDPDYQALAERLLPAPNADPNTYYDGPLPVVDSPDGALRAVGGNFEFRLLDAATDSVVWQTQEHRGFVTRLAFSPDGTLLASGDQMGGVRLWDIVAGGTEAGYTEVRIPSEDWTEEGSGVLTFNRQGTLIAFLNKGVVRVWDGRSRSLLSEAAVPLDEVSDMAFSRDGTHLVFAENATGYGDQAGQDTTFLRVWDVERRAFLHRDPVEHLGRGTLSPDGEWLAVARGNTVRVWDVAGGAFRGDPIRLPYPVTEVHFSTDAERLAITTGDPDGDKASVTVWDLGTQRSVGEPFEIPPYTISPVYFDGRSFRGLAFPTVRLWEWTGTAFREDSIALADVLPEFADGYDGPEPVLSPSGDLMAFGDCYTDCIHINIGLLDLEGRDAFWGSFDFGGGMMRSLLLSPDGRLLVIEYQGGGVQLWDVAGREELGVPLPHPADVDLLAFSPDGTHLATAGYDFGTRDDGADSALFMRLWDLQPSSWMEQACRLVNRNLSEQEWTALLGDRPYACTCTNLPPHPSTGLAACPAPMP